MRKQYSKITNSDHPNPALVPEIAVRPLPRWIFLGLCLLYILFGFVAREPWREADMASFGYMLELAQHGGDWFKPDLLGVPPQQSGLLALWLGAWAVEWSPAAWPLDEVVRFPFMLLLAATLAATWHAAYALAYLPQARPLAFALGGEAKPKEYARAIADSAVLALLATFGFMQFSHETTSSVAQLTFSALFLYAFSLCHWRFDRALFWAVIATVGLVLSGAPALTLLFLCIGLVWFRRSSDPWAWAVGLVLLAVCAVWISSRLDLWQYRLLPWEQLPQEMLALMRLLMWFTWPSALLALWALWRWRGRIWASSHLVLPLFFAVLIFGLSLFTDAGSRALFLSLPAWAILAAFALPTLTRRGGAFIDWVSLLLFAFLVLLAWLFWFSMHFGIPAWPARNLARLGPGFIPSFSSVALLIALLGTGLWLFALVWRASRMRKPIWKSLILPASGMTLVLLLLGSIGLPAFDYARSQRPLAARLERYIPDGSCVQVQSLGRSEMVALRFYNHYVLERASIDSDCPWLLVQGPTAQAQWENQAESKNWSLLGFARRPTQRNATREDMLIYYRKP